MKNGDYLSYEFFEKIDHKCALADFFNKIFHELHLSRMLSAPQIFNEDEKIRKETKRKYKERKVDNALRFYETCLFEVYAHAVVKRLNEWIETISEYINEYNGSWEYYTRTKRLECISKYGGDDKDYEENGAVRTDVPEDMLLHYSVICDLVQDDCKDIVRQTEPNDLDFIYRSIQVNGSFSIRDMFKAMGNNSIKSYRSENGVMVENSEDDELLHEISTSEKSKGNVAILFSIVNIISHIVSEIRCLPKNEDNKAYFGSLKIRLQKILDMDIVDEIKLLQRESTTIIDKDVSKRKRKA